MSNLSQQLPPIKSLIAFEAAARLSSFTNAAAELNITQAAVSQQIRLLEAALGTALFNRAHRAVSLTAEGREYQHSIAVALSHIAGASAAMAPQQGQTRLVIAADEAMAHLWLMPRLSRFTKQHPDIALQLIVSDRLEDCLAEPVDAALVFGGEQKSGFDIMRFFPEEVFPVCAPEYLAANPGIVDVSSLPEQTLIELEDERWDWMNWRIWLNGVANIAPQSTSHIRINSYPLVIAAVRSGLGIALGWRYMIDDDLAAGRLVRPIPQSLPTDYGYNLLTRHSATARPDLDHLRNWLIGEQVTMMKSN